MNKPLIILAALVLAACNKGASATLSPLLHAASTSAARMINGLFIRYSFV